MVLEKTLEIPLDCKEIQPVHPKGDQSWVFIGRTDVEAETPIIWPPDAKSWLIGKDPDAGKDWRREEKGTTEDEMVGWHQQLDGHGFGWTPGAGLDREAWHAAVHGVAKSKAWLNDWTELNCPLYLMTLVYMFPENFSYSLISICLLSRNLSSLKEQLCQKLCPPKKIKNKKKLCPSTLDHYRALIQILSNDVMAI